MADEEKRAGNTWILVLLSQPIPTFVLPPDFLPGEMQYPSLFKYFYLGCPIFKTQRTLVDTVTTKQGS